MSGVINKLVTDGTIQLVGAVGDVPFASVNIVIANPTPSSGTLLVWIGTGTGVAEADLVEPGAVIVSKGRYEDLGRICSPGEKIFVQAPPGLVARIESVDEE